MLIVMAGLPGSGKSSLAADLARARGCALLSVDPVEAAMWRAGVARSEPTGLAAYVVVEALAAEQLALGHDIIVDAVNAAPGARDQWTALARRAGADLRFIEVRCSDENEHRRRLSERRRGIAGFPEPTWESVRQRTADFDGWDEARLRLDSMDPRPDNLRNAMLFVSGPDPIS